MKETAWRSTRPKSRSGETIAFLATDGATRLDLSVAGGSTPTPPSEPTASVGRASLPLSETGVVSEAVTVRTGGGAGSLTVAEGTRARDKDGNPLGEVTVARSDAPGIPQAPPGTAIGFALDCGPAGATFDPPATLTYALSVEEWAKIGSATPKVMWYNPGTGEWQEVPATVDAATRTVTAQVSHFSLFALAWASATPAEATTGTAPGETPPGPGSQQPTGGETPWALIAAGVLVIAVLAGWYLLRKR
jgi:LPXTG-motif cell wall-anchored protein